MVKDITIKGELRQLEFGKTSFDERICFRVGIMPDVSSLAVLADEIKPAYEGTDEQFLPAWVKDNKKPVKLKSNFTIPITRVLSDIGELSRRYSLQEIEEEFGDIRGSEVLLKVRLKSENGRTNLYPVEMVITRMQQRTLSDFFNSEVANYED